MKPIVLLKMWPHGTLVHYRERELIMQIRYNYCRRFKLFPSSYRSFTPSRNNDVSPFLQKVAYLNDIEMWFKFFRIDILFLKFL